MNDAEKNKNLNKAREALRGNLASLVNQITTINQKPLTLKDVIKNFTHIMKLFSMTDVDYHNICDEVFYSFTQEGSINEETVYDREDRDHDINWIDKRPSDNDSWHYSDHNLRYMTESLQPIGRDAARLLNNKSKKLLGHLGDPANSKPWTRRGLLVGQVQSGKTMNYISLIASAMDVGYKFIIILTPNDKVLRKQTQRRINETLIGKDDSYDPPVNIGIGKDNKYNHPIPLTTTNNDFNHNVVLNMPKPSLMEGVKIVVVKKNVKILKKVQDLFAREEFNEGQEKKIQYPLLMIDDEADHSSINTKTENNPTAINSNIRNILNLFKKNSYIGITATPFANIFINHEDDNANGKDLYPKDFIHLIDPPKNYISASKVFLSKDDDQDNEDQDNDDQDNDDAKKYKWVKEIRDADEYYGVKPGDETLGIPSSMKKAYLTFIIIRSIRNIRGQKNKHCTMMINCTPRIEPMNRIQGYLQDFHDEVKDSIFFYAASDDVSKYDDNMKELMQIYKEDFLDLDNDVKADWQLVKDNLVDVIKNIIFKTLNSRSDDKLNYEEWEKDNTYQTVVVIGGHVLSRGLTLEGLSMTYMYRNTNVADVLLQLGRFFGYRPGYTDLCRIRLAPNIIERYEKAAKRIQDLETQFTYMNAKEKSPEQFGFYFKDSSSQIKVTSKNKSKSGRKDFLSIHYSLQVHDTATLPMDKKLNDENHELITEFWKKNFYGSSNSETVGERQHTGYFYKDIDTEIVIKFMEKVKIAGESLKISWPLYINYLKKIKEVFPKSDVYLASKAPNSESPEYVLSQKNFKALIRDEDKKIWRSKNSRIGSPADEKAGLTKEQITQANEQSGDPEATDSKKVVFYRAVRAKPLLVIHNINLIYKDSDGKEDPTKDQPNTPGFSISFPESNDKNKMTPILITTTYTSEQRQEDESQYEDEEI
jgi:hypothetical protein